MFRAMNRQRFQILCLLFIGGVLLWIASLGYVEQPVFSCESGFYEDAFYLEISASSASTIYYTLDGSTPDENSHIYTGPILISDATQNENNHSMRTDTSAGFLTDLIAQYQSVDGNPNYAAPDFLVDKCTVIRAVAVSPAGAVSEITSASYFVDISPQDYHGCNVISLITDPDNLFDSSTGIYVTGEILTDYLSIGDIASNWRAWNANYRQRGADWERPAIFEFFSSDGSLLLAKNGGIRTHGGISRGTLPRSLNLYAREEYDRTDTFDLPLFGTDYHPQRVTLNSGGNHLITQFPDYMMSEMVGDLNFATMHFAPYVLFVDGEYWGFYWLSEKYDEKYLAYRYQIRPENAIIIKVDAVDVGKAEDLQLYEAMTTFISQNDMSIEANYETACEMIDMESFIDYYATMIYIARFEDWPIGNTSLWRTRDISDPDSYSDGKWRWMLFDCNSASMLDDNLDDFLSDEFKVYFPSYNSLTYLDSLAYVKDKDALFRSLWNNPSFQEAFAQKLLYIGRNCFDAEKMDAFIQDYMDTMTPILEKSWARFYGSENNKYEEFCETMDSHRAFFHQRLAVVESWFQ